mmetsp:Transcript_39545/g.104789  ORF Transcript_39545/g.104789 Transcript_39545/m.104789 type:complete len:223 (+) Transcript_39545:509-1177(+)
MSLTLRWNHHLVDALHHLGINLHGVCRLEGRRTRHELENEHPQSPPVDRVRVPRRCNQLWREVVWGTASGVGLSDDELSEAHVCELYLTALVEEQILWLQVSVNDMPFMYMLERKDHSSTVELRMFLAAVESLSVVSRVQLASKRRFQEKVQGLQAIIALKELNYEWRIGHHQNGFLVHDTLLHSSLYNVTFAQSLHRVSVLCFFVFEKLYGTKSTTTQEPD